MNAPEAEALGKRGPGFARVALTLAVLLALFAGGYWVYHLVGGLLFRAQGAPIVPPDLVLAAAVLGGAASFFSPCSLVITPSFLVYFVDRDAGQQARGNRRLLHASLLIAAGIIGFYGAAAILVSTLGAVVYNFLIYLIPIVGLIFVALGAIVVLGRSAVLAGVARHLPGRRYYEQMLEGGMRGRRRDFIALGIAYGAASHSCTLPIFMGIILLPLAAGIYWLAGLAVLVYGVALAGLMLVMLVLGQPTVLAVRRWAGRYLQYAMGILFLGTGGYLVYYFLLNYGVTFAT